jgi:hypothetical protein
MIKEALPCTYDQSSVEYCIRIILTQKVRFSANDFTDDELCTRLRVKPEELQAFLSEYVDVDKQPDIVKLMRVADALDVHMTFKAETAEEIKRMHRANEIIRPDMY